MNVKKIWWLLSALLMVTMSAPVSAQFILQPTAVSSPQGSFGGLFDLSNIINQSGLSSAYVSGVTDFTTYTASATHNSDGSLNSGFTATNGGFPQQITFNLGATQDINGFAFWAVDNSGSVTQFRLFQDVDSDPSNGVGPQIGGVFNTLADGGAASPSQVFSFDSTTTQFVHLFVDNTNGGQTPGIGELAFAAVAVPEPTTWAMIGMVTLGTGVYTWKKRRQDMKNRFAKV